MVLTSKKMMSQNFSAEFKMVPYNKPQVNFDFLGLCRHRRKLEGHTHPCPSNASSAGSSTWKTGSQHRQLGLSLAFSPFDARGQNLVCTECCTCRLYWSEPVSSQNFLHGHRQSAASTPLDPPLPILSGMPRHWDWLLPLRICGSASNATVLMIPQRIRGTASHARHGGTG